MEHGFYWLHLEDGDPEVVEIDGDSMYRCGSDVTCRLEDGQWIEFGEPMDVISITGPIVPPNARAQADAACGVSPGAMGSAAHYGGQNANEETEKEVQNMRWILRQEARREMQARGKCGKAAG